MNCPYCNKKLTGNEKTCPNCKADVTSVKSASKKKSEVKEINNG